MGNGKSVQLDLNLNLGEESLDFDGTRVGLMCKRFWEGGKGFESEEGE